MHGGKNVTMSFWAKFDAHASSSTSAPYSFSVSIKNSALNRSYVKELSMTTDNTWQKFEFTFPTDTTGTWLFTEADKGAAISICMGTGSNFHGTNTTWEGARDYATSNQENLMDYVGNAFYLSQVSLTIGDTAPTFTSPSIATVADQVDYYVQRYNFDSTGEEAINVGQCFGAQQSYFPMQYRRKMRVKPSGSLTAAGTFACATTNGATEVVITAAHSGTGTNASRIYITKTTSNLIAGGAAMVTRHSTQVCWIQMDARH